MPPALREVLAFAVWIALALPTGFAYSLFLSHVLGRQMGFEWTAAIAVLPLAVMFVVCVLWLPAWAFARHRRRVRLGWQAPLLAAALVVAPAVVVCGGKCFRLPGIEPALVYFVMVPAAIAAYLHDRLSRAWLAPGDALP